MILVTGANGQLGSEIRELTAGSTEFIFTDLELDITSEEALRTFLTAHKIEFAVNCAAYTAVDKAESESEKAALVNAAAPGLLAKLAKEFGFVLIQISTDFVFDGSAQTPYTEELPTAPLGIYGKTKDEGEKAVLNSVCNAAIIRTAWLYSRYGNNIVKTILKLGAARPEFGFVFDQTGTPTWAHDLAGAVLEMIKKMQNGTLTLNGAEIFHYTNEGVASWYDLAWVILAKTALPAKVKPIRTADYPTPAVRPAYSVLDKKKIRERLQITIPHWQESLDKCLAQLKEDGLF